MGVYLEHFFNYHGEIDELIVDLDKNLWSRDWRLDRGAYWGIFLGVTFWIETPTYMANEGERDFENYRFAIKTKLVYRPAIFHHTQLAVTLSLIYMVYERLGIKDGMLTWDGERLLAKYQERDGALYDLVSDTPFTNFAEHMKTIEQRLPHAWRE